MKTLVLERFAYSPMGTFGRLFYPVGSHPNMHYTVEQPWNDNLPFQSCIPEGRYQCHRFTSQKHPNTWEVINVPNRTAILFHVGNTMDDFEGCIGLGLDLGFVNKKWAVVASQLAFAQFLATAKPYEPEFTLDIRRYAP